MSDVQLVGIYAVITLDKGGMIMQLVTGGAYTGKRAYIRNEFVHRTLGWVSGYEGHDPDLWLKRWNDCSVLIMEGWEKWVLAKLLEGESEEDVQNWVLTVLRNVLKEEEKRADLEDNNMKHESVFVILEIGRGVVPISPEERAMRDIIGRLAQTAAHASKQAIYLWHGLPSVIKPI